MDVRSCSLLSQNYQKTLGQFKKTDERFSTVANLKDIKVEVLEKRVIIENAQYRYYIPLENIKVVGNPKRLLAGSLVQIRNQKEYGMALSTEEYRRSMWYVKEMLIKKLKSLPQNSKEADQLDGLLTKINSLLKFAEQKFFCDSLTDH
jgi:hypothetical protein